MANKKNTINIKIGADSKMFTSEIKKVQRTLRKQGRKLKRLGTSMSKSLTLPLVGVGLAATKTTAEFEQAMAKVKAISGATGKQFEMLNKNALDLGRTTRYTASQVASLQLNLSKLGFDPTEIKAATASILDLALATGEDLSDSATTVAATIKGFNLTAQDSGHVADVMAKSFSSSALDLHKFSTAMAVVAPVANKANVSLEEAASILGILTDRGVDAGTSGVSLRNIYLDLAENGLSWADAMKQLKSSTNPLSLAMELFGKRGATVATIIADNVDEIDKMTKSFANSDGAAKAMAKIMDNTLNGALLRMKSALEGVAIDIGTSLTPMITKFTQRIIKLSDWFVNLSDGSKKFIGVVAGLLTVAGPLLLVLGSINMAVASLVPVLNSMGVAITGSLGPLGLLIGGLTLLGTLIYRVTKARKDRAEAVRKENVVLDASRELSKRTVGLIQKEVFRVKELLSVARDETKAKRFRLSAIKKLNNINPDYIKGITLENVNTKKVTSSIETYIGVLRKKAKAQAANKLLAEQFEAQIQNNIAIAKAEEDQLAAVASKQKENNDLREDGYAGREINVEAIETTTTDDSPYQEDKNVTDVNQEYQKQVDLLKAKGYAIEDNIKLLAKEGAVLTNQPEVDIETSKFDPTGTEEDEEKLAKKRLKWADQLRLMEIENGKNEKKRLIETAKFHSEIKKREIEEENKGDDLKIQREKLLAAEQIRIDQEVAQITNDYNKKKKEERFDQEMAALDKLANETEAKLLETAKTKDELEAGNLKNDQDYLDKKLAIYEKYGKDVSAIQLAIAKLDYETTNGLTENLTDAEQRLKDTMENMAGMIQSFVTEQVVGLIDAIGQELNGSTQAIDRWADNILKSFGEFISKLGAMMMAYGTAKLVIETGAPSHAMIAAGAIMVGLGGAIKQHIKRKEEKALEANGGGGLDGGYSSQLNSSNNYGSGQNVVVLETVVYGNDILLSSNRQHNTVERTRRK